MKNKKVCNICKSKMKKGIVLVNTMLYFDDFGNDAGQRGTTGSRLGKAYITKCYKCTKCGHSYIPNNYKKPKK